MKLTLGEAAKVTNVSKGTLSKAIKSGKISAHRNENGSFSIDPAELSRVFPKQVETPQDEQLETPVEAHGNAFEVSRLQVELEATQREAAILRDTITDLRTDRDAWRQQTERQTLLLQDHRNTEAGSERVGWFDKLLGRGSK